MLGWNIGVYRQTENVTLPATVISQVGVRLAVWQTGFEGVDWIDKLVKENKVIDLGGNGYPNRYTVTANNIIPFIKNNPPLAKDVWSSDEGDILTEKWEGKTVLDQSEIEKCPPDEWLIVDAWDES